MPGGGPNCTTACHFRCDPTPHAGYRGPALPGKGTVKAADKSPDKPDKKDRLNWKYVKGAATTLADFGDSTTTTSYVLCVYDSAAAAQPLLLAPAPAGGTCGTKPCWKPIKGGLKYNDKLFIPRRPAAGAAEVGRRDPGQNSGEGKGSRPADADAAANHDGDRAVEEGDRRLLGSALLDRAEELRGAVPSEGRLSGGVRRWHV